MKSLGRLAKKEMENHLLDRLSEFKETEPDHSIYKIPN